MLNFRRIDSLVQRKRDILDTYRARLLGSQGVSMNAEIPGTSISAWMPTVVFSENLGITRELLQSIFKGRKLTREYFFGR